MTRVTQRLQVFHRITAALAARHNVIHIRRRPLAALLADRMATQYHLSQPTPATPIATCSSARPIVFLDTLPTPSHSLSVC